MSAELKPCPFCGGQAQTDFIEGESYIIECYLCAAQTGHMDSSDDAIELWNRRATPAPASGEPVGYFKQDASGIWNQYHEDYPHPHALTALYRTHPATTSAAAAEASDVEFELRKLLAIQYAGVVGLYADDGELQDSREAPWIDFKRDTPDEIGRKMVARTMKALAAHQPPAQDSAAAAKWSEQMQEKKSAADAHDKAAAGAIPAGIVQRTEEIRMRLADPSGITRANLIHYAECLLAHIALLKSAPSPSEPVAQAEQREAPSPPSEFWCEHEQAWRHGWSEGWLVGRQESPHADEPAQQPQEAEQPRAQDGEGKLSNAEIWKACEQKMDELGSVDAMKWFARRALASRPRLTDEDAANIRDLLGTLEKHEGTIERCAKHAKAIRALLGDEEEGE